MSSQQYMYLGGGAVLGYLVGPSIRPGTTPAVAAAVGLGLGYLAYSQWGKPSGTPTKIFNPTSGLFIQ